MTFIANVMRRSKNSHGILPAIGIASFLAVAVFALPVLAAHGLETSGAAAGFGGTETNLTVIIGGFVSALLGLVGVVLLLLTIYAGFLWMTAAGNEERIAKAKKIIMGSVIGAIIAVAAYAITSFVVDVIQPAQEGVTEAGTDVDFVEGEDPIEESLTPGSGTDTGGDSETDLLD